MFLETTDEVSWRPTTNLVLLPVDYSLKLEQAISPSPVLLPFDSIYSMSIDSNLKLGQAVIEYDPKAKVITIMFPAQHCSDWDESDDWHEIPIQIKHEDGEVN